MPRNQQSRSRLCARRSKNRCRCLCRRRRGPSREPDLLCLPQSGTADFCADRGAGSTALRSTTKSWPGNWRSSPSFSTATARTICWAREPAGRPTRPAMPCGRWPRPVGSPTQTTAAVAEYLLLRHKDKDHWLNYVEPAAVRSRAVHDDLHRALRPVGVRHDGAAGANCGPHGRRCASGSSKRPPRTTKIASSACGRCKRPMHQPATSRLRRKSC